MRRWRGWPYGMKPRFCECAGGDRVGRIELAFAVGPADGFSEAARSAAQHTISLGRMTLAHELARVVLLEQIYRAFMILKGHPYHSEH